MQWKNHHFWLPGCVMFKTLKGSLPLGCQGTFASSCWGVTSTFTSLSTELLSSHSFPSLCLCQALLHPSCSTQYHCWTSQCCCLPDADCYWFYPWWKGSCLIFWLLLLAGWGMLLGGGKGVIFFVWFETVQCSLSTFITSCSCLRLSSRITCNFSSLDSVRY